MPETQEWLVARVNDRHVIVKRNSWQRGDLATLHIAVEAWDKVLLPDLLHVTLDNILSL
jgi:hypothetical protein